MAIQTQQAFSEAVERLRKRDPASLAHFIATLALDSGPIGEQACTFIVGDAVAAASASVSERIGAFRRYEPHEYSYRHEFGAEMGQRLALIVDAIEALVIPRDPRGAFDLLVQVIESDGHAMETCGEHACEVSCAIERAIELINEVVRSLPPPEVLATLQALLASDGYGVRRPLAGVIEQLEK